MSQFKPPSQPGWDPSVPEQTQQEFPQQQNLSSFFQQLEPAQSPNTAEQPISPIQRPPIRRSWRKSSFIAATIIISIAVGFVLSQLTVHSTPASSSVKQLTSLYATNTTLAGQLTAIDSTLVANASTQASPVDQPTPQLTDTSTPVSQPTTVPTPTSQSNTSNIGLVIIVGNWNVTLNKVYTSSGGEFQSAKPGEIFVVVDVTVVNTSSSAQLMSSGALFIFQDESGQSYDETVAGIGKTPDGTVQPGNKLRGQISYEVSKSLHNFTLQFQDKLGDGSSTTWNLSI